MMVNTKYAYSDVQSCKCKLLNNELFVKALKLSKYQLVLVNDILIKSENIILH